MSSLVSGHFCRVITGLVLHGHYGQDGGVHSILDERHS